MVEILHKLSIGKSRKSKKQGLDFEPVIMKGNFNRSRYDQTIWYAFIDEKKWGIDSCKPASTPIMENSIMEKGEIHDQKWTYPSPVPDTKTDSKKHSSQKHKVSEEAKILSETFLKEIQKEKPDFKPPGNFYNWNDCFDKMLRIDGRDMDKITAIIEWVTHDSFWKSNILSPSKLRDKFDQLELKMLTPTTTGVDPEKHKKMAAEFAKKNVNRSKDFFLGEAYIEFIYGGQTPSALIYYEDKKFTEKVKAALMKWGPHD